jgi:hypothetical protein
MFEHHRLTSLIFGISYPLFGAYAVSVITVIAHSVNQPDLASVRQPLMSLNQLNTGTAQLYQTARRANPPVICWDNTGSCPESNRCPRESGNNMKTGGVVESFRYPFPDHSTARNWDRPTARSF